MGNKLKPSLPNGMGMDFCFWAYRPGTQASHWATIRCNSKTVYLSKIPEGEQPRVGVADYYNGKICPWCGRIVKVGYEWLQSK